MGLCWVRCLALPTLLPKVVSKPHLCCVRGRPIQWISYQSHNDTGLCLELRPFEGKVQELELKIPHTFLTVCA